MITYKFEQMKTVTQIKDDLAKEQGYPSYQEYIKEINGNFYCAERLEKFYDEVIRRTVMESLKNASENAKLTITEFSKRKDGSIGWNEVTLKDNLYIINDGCNIVADKQSILNESNIPSF